MWLRTISFGISAATIRDGGGHSPRLYMWKIKGAALRRPYDETFPSLLFVKSDLAFPLSEAGAWQWFSSSLGPFSPAMSLRNSVSGPSCAWCSIM